MMASSLSELRRLLSKLKWDDVMKLEKAHFYDSIGIKGYKENAEKFEKLMDEVCNIYILFGKYKGKKLKDLPRRYLEMLFKQIQLDAPYYYAELIAEYCKST